MPDFFRRTGLLPAEAAVYGANLPAAVLDMARILRARFGELIQICDGVADNVEIQAAINALTAGRTWKETVKLVGSFSIGATLNLPSYIVLDLTEARLTLANGVNADMFDVPNRDYVDFIGGILDGNRANQAAGSGINIRTATSNYIVIQGVQFSNFFLFSIIAEDAADIKILDCLLTGSGDRNLVLTRTTRVKVLRCYIFANNANQNIVVSGAGTTTSDIEIGFCRIDNSRTQAIIVSSAGAAQPVFDINIHDNVINSPLGSAIFLDGTNMLASRISVVKNHIFNAADGSLGDQDAILGGPGTGFIVTGNFIYSPYAGGITLVTVTNSVVNDNYVIYAGARGLGGVGLELTRCSYLTVVGNVAQLTNDDGIRLWGCSYCSVTGNTIRDSSQRANNTFFDISLAVSVGVNSVYNTVSANVMNATQANRVARNIDEADVNQNYNRYNGNSVSGAVTAPMRIQGANSRARHNTGYVTEGSGNSIGTGAQQTIAHGLGFTPTAQQIALTAGSATALPYHSAAPDATNIYDTAALNQPW